MNFGKWIVVAFVSFAVYITALVIICVRQDVPLVSKSYYRDELQYQQKLDRINNAGRLDHLPTIVIKNGSVKVTFPASQSIQNGKLKIERPANEALDRHYSLAPSQATQQFSLGKWMPGLYRASLSWTMDGKEFYLEKQMVL